MMTLLHRNIHQEADLYFDFAYSNFHLAKPSTLTSPTAALLFSPNSHGPSHHCSSHPWSYRLLIDPQSSSSSHSRSHSHRSVSNSKQQFTPTTLQSSSLPFSSQTSTLEFSPNMSYAVLSPTSTLLSITTAEKSKLMLVIAGWASLRSFFRTHHAYLAHW